MTQLIENALKTVQENFLKREWCELNNISLHTENYQDECQQEYYLLKYFPAYLAEYYDMYSELFKIYDRDSINIVSIGCGAGIDYYALDGITNKPKINYYGVDLIDWKYRADFSFEQMDITQLRSSHFDEIDLIVFPKILTELSDEQVTDLATKIVDSKLPNEIYFLNSYITKDSHEGAIGQEKFKIICKALLSNNYIIEGDNGCTQYTYFVEHKGIRSHIPFFIYPEEIKTFLSDLKSNCKELDNKSKECTECNIGEFPMMNSKYIANNVIKFVKNDN